jgi:hypothetical protein
VRYDKRKARFGAAYRVNHPKPHPMQIWAAQVAEAVKLMRPILQQHIDAVRRFAEAMRPMMPVWTQREDAARSWSGATIDYMELDGVPVAIENEDGWEDSHSVYFDDREAVADEWAGIAVPDDGKDILTRIDEALAIIR